MRKRREFQRIRRLSGKSQVGSFLVVDSCPSTNGRTRLGITVTRRFGNAVQRNRAKRLIREAFRQCDPPKGRDIHIRPRHAIRDIKLAPVLQELKTLFLKIHLP